MTADHDQLERLIEVGRHREAERLLGELLAGAPGDADAHYLGAQLALAQHDAARATEHVERALAAEPGHFGARLMLFSAQWEQRRFGEAEETITGLIRERPQNASLFALYARLMLVTLHLDRAAALTAEALRLEPDNRQARLVHLLLLTLEGRRRDAGEQLAQLIREDPDSEQMARTLLAVLISERRSREALEVGRQLLRLDPRDGALIAALIELRTSSHWLALPAYPLNRWGWPAAALLWGAAVLAIRTAYSVSPAWGGALLAGYLLWAVYTWTYPPLLRRWLRWRGF